MRRGGTLTCALFAAIHHAAFSSDETRAVYTCYCLYASTYHAVRRPLAEPHHSTFHRVTGDCGAGGTLAGRVGVYLGRKTLARPSSSAAAFSNASRRGKPRLLQCPLPAQYSYRCCRATLTLAASSVIRSLAGRYYRHHCRGHGVVGRRLLAARRGSACPVRVQNSFALISLYACLCGRSL